MNNSKIGLASISRRNRIARLMRLERIPDSPRRAPDPNVLIAYTCSRRGHTVKRFLIFCLLLAGGAAAVRGQSALDGFDPNANGAIYAVVIQPDGKILIGGDFNTVSPNGGVAVPRNRIARLNPDGTLDTAFDANNVNGTVFAIALQADGKILVGGDFFTIGGQTRIRIARLDAATGLADSFDPNANSTVLSIAVQADGKILVGGNFIGANSIGGQTRNRIARLDPATGMADSFNPNANSGVRSIVVQADGKILVGGFFNGANSIGGQTRNYIARLDAATGLADSFNPNANNTVRSLAVQADGKILAGGGFNGANSIGGATRNYIARLDAATGLADSFNPNANDDVQSIAVQADGKILVGGSFNQANGTPTIGGQTRNRVARLDAVTGLADSFEPNATKKVRSVAVQADGKILAGGDFLTLGPNGGAAVTRNHIGRLEIDGTLDRTLDLSIVGNVVFATAVQPDGKTLIGGSFSSVLGVTRNGIARLNTDGTLDTAFNPNAQGSVYAIAVQPDGKILVGGFFLMIGGQTRNFIARLDATTGLADSFNPNASYYVNSIAVQADGKILVGGGFNVNYGTIGGQVRNYIARLDPATGLADSFNPNANNTVFSIAVQPDGKILVGGYFNGANSIGGQTRNYIARLDATTITGLADSFDPNANGPVHSIALQSDGKILVGGGFTHIGGQTRDRIARLDATTGLADSFDPNADGIVYSIAVQADGKILVGGDFSGPNSIGTATRQYIARLDATTGLADSFNPNAENIVYSIALQADGKILAGGLFYYIGGPLRNCFARLSNDTGALQNLGATQTTISWTRGGSSAQFARVTFEYSSDNVNYNLLGNGTATGSDWTLTGLNLPTQQNLYIRARGYYSSGQHNGSGSIQESVRNVFLEPIIAPSSVVSRKTHGPDPDPLKTFDINLPLTGPVGIECRRNTGADTTGPNLGRDHDVVITFPSPVTVGGTSVTSNDMADTPSATFSVSSNVVTVYLHNIASAPRRLTINLLNTSDGTIVSVPMGVLLGDTTADGSVNSADIGQTKSQSGHLVTSSNFREDVTVDGSINSADIGLVKSKSGTALP